jgi:tRNA(Ile)-lysidine synthase
VKSLHSLAAKVQHWLSVHEIGPGRMVAAVSGGPDSVALLLALLLVRPGEPLVLAHLNHLLRGPESDADEQFVRQLHAKLSETNEAEVQLRVERRDIARDAALSKMNLEAAGRRCRYEWLRQVAQETGSPWLATGHTADDQAETVLHRLLRGTGIRGLRGIAPTWTIAPGTRLLRPLLQVTRHEVLDFLEEQRQSFRDDSSNRNPRHTRNRLRHELLPLLEDQYNPAVRSLLAGLAEQAKELFEDLEHAAGRLLAAAELPLAGSLRILDRGVLSAAPPLVAREALRLLWQRADWPMSQMTFEKWRRLLAVCQDDRTSLDLPGGIRARSRGAVMQIGRTT